MYICLPPKTSQRQRDKGALRTHTVSGNDGVSLFKASKLILIVLVMMGPVACTGISYKVDNIQWLDKWIALDDEQSRQMRKNNDKGLRVGSGKGFHTSRKGLVFDSGGSRLVTQVTLNKSGIETQSEKGCFACHEDGGVRPRLLVGDTRD